MEYFVGRRYGDFARMHKRLQTELPGKVLPPLPRKNKQSTTASGLISSLTGGKDDDASSISSVSTMGNAPSEGSGKNLKVRDHRRSASSISFRSSPRTSIDVRNSTDGLAPPGSPGLPPGDQPVLLWREAQRVSLRAFLRTCLSNSQIANTGAMREFLSLQPITPKDADILDIERRKVMDEKRVEEQKQFYEIARKRAAELDIYMEQYVLGEAKNIPTRLLILP